MPRTSIFLAVCGLLTGVLALSALPAGAQTADLNSFCAGRVTAETAESKAATKAALGQLQTTAPAAVQGPTAQLAALFAKKGNKAFESKEGGALIEQIDAFVFANCGFNKLNVTGIDYEFQGLPSSIPKGTVALTFTNTAPKEQHEIVVFKLKPGAESTDPEKLLSLSEKKAMKKVEFEQAAFAMPGDSGTSVGSLDPGKYLAACFIPVGGKKNGAPHFTKGMFTTFDVPA